MHSVHRATQVKTHKMTLYNWVWKSDCALYIIYLLTQVKMSFQT